MAVPGELAANFIKTGKPEQQYASEDESDNVQHSPIINQIVQTLQTCLYLKNNEANVNNNNNNNLIVSNLSANQKEAIYTDINELAVYSKMYYDIETVKSDPLIADEYLLSNLPIVGKLTRLKSNRIAVLEKQIKWIETHFYQHHHHGSNNNDRNIKQLKQELAELLEEDAKADKLRRLPLYSCRITGFKFVCSKCYDKVYMYATAKTLIP